MTGGSPTQGSPPPLVLIADNDGAVGALLQSVLERYGLRTLAVADGDEALAVLGRQSVALLVCDLDMPRVGGREVVQRLAELPAPPPVVIVSGYLDAALERELVAAPGVLAVLRKPFDVLAFAELAQRTVGEHGSAATGTLA